MVVNDLQHERTGQKPTSAESWGGLLRCADVRRPLTVFLNRRSSHRAARPRSLQRYFVLS